jgi:predicted MFS family arabinose efflux permease
MNGFWSFLRAHPAFMRLWLATAVAELGSAVARIAMILLVHERAVRTSAAPETANALMLIAETLPMVLAGTVAGALVDRWDRRRLLVGCSLVQAALIVSVPFVAQLEAIWPLYVLAMIISGLSTVFPPARQSAIPDLVGLERVETANAIASSTTSLVVVLAAGVAGLLVDTLGKDACFRFNAATFVFAAIAILPLALPRHALEHRPAREIVGEIFQGFAYVRTQPVVFYIVLCYLMAFLFIGIWFPLVPEYLRRDLGIDVDTWMPRSWLAFGLGGIVGGAIGPWIGRKVGLGRAIVLTFFLEPIMIGAYYFVGSAWPMLAVSFAWGVLAFAYFVQEQTALHQDVRPELRGRVFGLLPPLQALGMLLANGIVLAEAGTFEPSTMLLLAGAGYMATSFVFTFTLRGAKLLWNRPRDQLGG